MRLISKKVLTLKTFVIMSMHIPQEIGGWTAGGKDVFGSMLEPQESPVVRTVHIQMCAWQACLCRRTLFWSPIALEGGRAG